MDDDTCSRTRKLYIPNYPSTESEYEAIRNARKENDETVNQEVTYSEELLEKTARTLATTDLDAERFLQRLRQPSSTLGVDPADVYEERVGNPAFPEEPVRLDIDETRWISGFCNDALVVIEETEIAGCNDEKTKIYWLLRRLREFCDAAVELGVRPALTRY